MPKVTRNKPYAEHYQRQLAASAAAAPIVADVERAIDHHIRVNLVAIAAHYGVSRSYAAECVRRAGLKLPPGHGPLSDEQLRDHLRVLPHIRLHTPPAADDAEGEEVAEDRPSPHELEDACARWGIDGAAEEYEVSADQVCAWLRADGLAQERAAALNGHPTYETRLARMLTPEQVIAACATRRSGTSWGKIARSLGVNAGTLQRRCLAADPSLA